MTWWANRLEERLSQGDVFSDVPAVTAAHPLTSVTYSDAKGGKRLWHPSAVSEKSQIIAKGPVGLVVVLSHSCELDKKERKGLALVAPIRSAAALESEHWMHLMTQLRRSLLPIPDLPSHGNCYADLRMMTSVDRRFLKDDSKLVSMNEEAVRRLQNQLFAFLVRPELREDLTPPG